MSISFGFSWNPSIDGTKTVNGVKYYLTRDSGAPTGARGIKAELIDNILENTVLLEK